MSTAIPGSFFLAQLKLQPTSDLGRNGYRGEVFSELPEKFQTREGAQIIVMSRVANLRIPLWVGLARRAERRGQACGARRNGLLPVESTKTWAGWEVEKYN